MTKQRERQTDTALWDVACVCVCVCETDPSTARPFPAVTARYRTSRGRQKGLIVNRFGLAGKHA